MNDVLKEFKNQKIYSIIRYFKENQFYLIILNGFEKYKKDNNIYYDSVDILSNSKIINNTSNSIGGKNLTTNSLIEPNFVIFPKRSPSSHNSETI